MASDYRPAVGVEQYLATAVATDGNPAVAKSQHLSIGNDFPMVCEVCLGPNPYIRMIKLRFGDKLCKLSGVAFQAFRWKAGPEGRFKETIVCKEVALEKNVCQACLSDMSYGVPVGVRDALLASQEHLLEEEEVPISQANRAYHYQNVRKNQNYGNSRHGSQELVGLARSIQTANSGVVPFRNLAKLCSFWLKGCCSRVHNGTCPFRPCNKQFEFPELAATHSTERQQLIDLLRRQGAAMTMKTLPAELQSLLKDTISGNNAHQAIRDRLSGQDEDTARYLKRIAPSHTTEPAETQALRPELMTALAQLPSKKRHKPYPSMDPLRLGTQPIPSPPQGPPPPEAFLPVENQNNEDSPPLPRSLPQNDVPPPPPPLEDDDHDSENEKFGPSFMQPPPPPPPPPGPPPPEAFL